MSEKRRRVELSMKEKLEIIAACEGPQKQSFAAVAKKFNIDRSTVSKIYKKREIITQLASSSNISRKRQRSSKVEGVDEALYRWFVSATGTDLPINGEILRTKAENFASELGLERFLASKGWLDRWKRRYGIMYKKAHSEKVRAGVKASDEWLSTALTEVLHRYEANDIYNAVETELYWRALPDGSSISSEVQISGDEIASDRLTVLVCASMTGEKRPLLVIGKSKTPHCFHIKNPPVQYKHNGNAGMTCSIFENWLCEWDKELALHQRRVALIVDNYAAHKSLGFQNIELIFWSPKVTSLIQPCHQGIICALKTYYRHLIIRRLLATIESSDQDVSPQQLIQKIDLLSSIRLLKESWDMVTDDTVVNSFRKAKFFKDGTNVSTLDNDMFTFVKDENDFESFVDASQHLECIEPLSEIKTEPEESVVSIEIKEEEPDTDIPEVVVTKATALECLQLLQTFLSNGDVQEWEHFNKVEAQVQEIILKKPFKMVDKAKKLENLRREYEKFLADEEKIRNEIDLQNTIEKAQRRKDFISRLELERREASQNGVVLKAQEVGNLVQNQLEQEEKLAAEMDLIKRQEILEMKMRQHLRENNHELKELESVLKAAYVKKTIASQLAEKEANRLEDQLREKKAREVLEKALGTLQEQEMQRSLKEKREKEIFKHSLQDQIIEKERMRQDEFIVFLKEKKMYDDILQTIKDEEVREEEEKRCRKQKTKEEMEQFFKAREIWKAKERLTIQEEEEKRRQINKKKEQVEIQNDTMKKIKQENFEIIYKKLFAEIQEKQRKLAEREELLTTLMINEKEEEEKRKAQMEIELEISRKKEARLSFQQILAAKALKRKEEKEAEIEFSRLMKERLEEEERKEEEKQKQRREALINNRKYNEEAMKRNVYKRAEELKLAQLINHLQEKEEKHRLELVEEERFRMLKEHAPRLLGYFPKGALRDTDLDMLGLTGNSPRPETCPLEK